MRDCSDDHHLIALNGIDHVVRKTTQDKLSKFIIHRTAYAWLRCNDGSNTMHFGDEGNAKSRCLVFVVACRFAKLDICFRKKPNFHSRSAKARRNTSSAGMASP